MLLKLLWEGQERGGAGGQEGSRLEVVTSQALTMTDVSCSGGVVEHEGHEMCRMPRKQLEVRD